MEKVKANVLKPIGFDTYKNDWGLTDVKARIVNASTGVLVPGCEVNLAELPVDHAELAFKVATVTADIVAGTKTLSVSAIDAAKFGVGDIVTVKTGTDVEVFAAGTVETINYTSGIITLTEIAKIDAAVADLAQIKIVDATGTYTGNIQTPAVPGSYFVWISSVKAGKDYNYGMIEVVEKDINDVLAGIEEIKTKISGGGASGWGTMHI